KGWLKPWVCDCSHPSHAHVATEPPQEMDESGSYPEMEGEARYAEERKDAPASEPEAAEIQTESTETSADALEPHLLELRGIPIEDAEKAKAARKDFVI